MSDDPAELGVLIVGAGPTGLTLAIELQRRGVPHRLIERELDTHEDSRATTLHARSLEMFADLGVLEPVLEAGYAYTQVSIYSEGKLLLRSEVSGGDTPYSFVIGLAQHETERMLERRLETLGGRVERGVRLAYVTQDDAGIHAVLLYGDGRWEEPPFAYVVGCDGARSVVRHALAIPFEGSTYPEDFFMADMRFVSGRPQDELIVQSSARGMLFVTPLPGDCQVRAGGDLPPGFEGELDAATAERLVRERFGGELDISDVNWTARFRINTRQVAHYREGRAFLCGDASHVHSPVSGHGMNTGMQDAYNLGWKLALVMQGHAEDALLDSYHAERHPVGRAQVRDAETQTDLIMDHQSVRQRLMFRLGQLLTGLSPIRQRLVDATLEISIAYRDSPIVAEHRESLFSARLVRNEESELPSVADFRDFSVAPQPGDRAPDVALDEGSLFGLLHGVEHNLMLFDGMAPTEEGYANLERIAAIVEARWPGLVRVHVIVPQVEAPASLAGREGLILDAQRRLHARYGAGSECLYLVRPDGYVGFRSQPADGHALVRYFEAMLGR